MLIAEPTTGLSLVSFLWISVQWLTHYQYRQYYEFIISIDLYMSLCTCIHVFNQHQHMAWDKPTFHGDVIFGAIDPLPPRKQPPLPQKKPYKLTFCLKLHIPFSSLIHHILSSSGSCSHYFNARPLESFSDAPRQRFSIIFRHEEEYQPANLVLTLTYLLPFLSLYC